MDENQDLLDQRLLEDFQRDLPLVPRPFAAIGAELGVGETTALKRLAAMQAEGKIARVGATCRPNTAGASTLAALAVHPQERIDEIAAIVGAEPGVNHSYLREHDWNLWFVATAPDAGQLAESLTRIERRTGFDVLDLPLVRAFNIDLGFRLSGPRQALPDDRPTDLAVLRDDDRPILQAMTEGLDLVPRPFAKLASRLRRSEAEVIARISDLLEAGILTRAGIIVRHRALGWRSNAMVVWDLPEARIEEAGLALMTHPGITLCYQRRTVPGVWPYGLFSMIHARSRAEALAILREAAELPALQGASHEVLFSTRCFKQTGALVHAGVAA